MANFTSDIKRELLAFFPDRRQGAVAAFSALLSTGGIVRSDHFEFVSENERIAEYFLRLAEAAFGVRPEVKEAVFDPRRERDKLTFSYGGELLPRILQESALLEDAELSALAAEEDAALFYLRAAFLGGGSCTLPGKSSKTGYHMEFGFFSYARARQFTELLERFELLARMIVRGERTIVYLKSQEALADFLFVVGAQGALRTIESVASSRAENNMANRVFNCYAGNADKSAIASAKQVMALEAMARDGSLELLPSALKETALARLAAPTLSLSELAKSLGVSKSCLNHRMRKLIELQQRREEYD